MINTYCEYSGQHTEDRVPDTDIVHALVDGRAVPACAACADFAHRLAESGRHRREEIRMIVR